MSDPTRDFPRRQPSKSGDAARDAERDRVLGMSIEERMLEALRLHDAHAKLAEASQGR